MFTNPEKSLREFIQCCPLAVSELNLDGKDGRLVEAKLWGAPHHTPQHRSTGIIAILEDISAQKQNEDKRETLE